MSACRWLGIGADGAKRLDVAGGNGVIQVNRCALRGDLLLAGEAEISVAVQLARSWKPMPAGRHTTRSRPYWPS